MQDLSFFVLSYLQHEKNGIKDTNHACRAVKELESLGLKYGDQSFSLPTDR